MPAAHRHAGFVVVLPARSRIAAVLEEHAGWLLHGDVRRTEPARETLLEVLDALDSPLPRSLAALRLWGQTGERPREWVAAADPVHLQAMRDHLRLHAIPQYGLAADECAQLHEALQSLLDRPPQRILRVGRDFYVIGGNSFATAAQSPAGVEGRAPDAFLPSGEGAAGHDRLIGELQLLLHAHDINRLRSERGEPQINSIWFWGGGEAPSREDGALPPLIADDPLFIGCWRSRGAAVSSWPDTADDALRLAAGAGVAVLPDSASASDASRLLAGLRRGLLRGRWPRLRVIFRDEWQVALVRGRLLRFWRAAPPEGWT
ncbi:MAG: hypothetical protein ACREQZ_15435, partial [Woeseiaceae bacterium]